MVRKVVEEVDEETVVVVLGDHGMDVKGDHGGESLEEVSAALWMYTKKSGVFGRSVGDGKRGSSDGERLLGWQYG